MQETEETRDLSLGREDSPGGEHGNPLQYSCLENPTDRGTWWATVHGVTKSRTQLKRLSMKVSDCHHGLQNPCWVKREMRRLGGKRDSGEGQWKSGKVSRFEMLIRIKKCWCGSTNQRDECGMLEMTILKAVQLLRMARFRIRPRE